MSSDLNRREFLGEASCKLVGSSALISSLLSLKLVNHAAAASLPNGAECKSLVCVLLAGGNDSFNFLVPRDGRYSQYATARGGVGGDGVALAQNTLNDLTQDPSQSNDGGLYGLHPSCGKLADMFNGAGSFAGNRRLSFVANIGTLVQPTSMTAYRNGSVPLPMSLFSHADQIQHWQTSIAQGMPQLSGWAGRMADVLHSQLNTDCTAMSISLAGNNVFQIGNSSAQFAITSSGGLLPTAGNFLADRKNLGINNLIDEQYSNLFRQAYADHLKDSIAAQEAFDATFRAGSPSSVDSQFPNTRLGRDLKAAARTISVRKKLGLRRSTIFVQFGGWDHHGELLNTHAGMLTDLSDSLHAFQLALEDYGVANDTITYTASDFGRTLRSNGRGTDHAWGGNQMVMGGPVQGGKVFGTFPELTIGGADDVGQGRLLPTVSIDQFFGELALWFGVSTIDLKENVLPNLKNFVNLDNLTDLSDFLGFVKPGEISLS